MRMRAWGEIKTASLFLHPSTFTLFPCFSSELNCPSFLPSLPSVADDRSYLFPFFSPLSPLRLGLNSQSLSLSLSLSRRVFRGVRRRRRAGAARVRAETQRCAWRVCVENCAHSRKHPPISASKGERDTLIGAGVKKCVDCK